jgi:hypothetical protein
LHPLSVRLPLASRAARLPAVAPCTLSATVSKSSATAVPDCGLVDSGEYVSSTTPSQVPGSPCGPFGPTDGTVMLSYSSIKASLESLKTNL